MKKLSILILSLAFMLLACNKSNVVTNEESNPNTAEQAPPPSSDYIDLTSSPIFAQMITVDSSLSAIIASSINTTNYDDFYDALDNTTNKNEIDSVLTSFGINASDFGALCEDKVDLIADLIATYPEFENNEELFGNSIYYAYEVFYENNSRGYTKVGCIEVYNRARSACHREYAEKLVVYGLTGMAGPAGGAVALIGISIATYNLNACLNDAWANYQGC